MHRDDQRGGRATPPRAGHGADEHYEPSVEDRKALVEELRAQIRSGTYRPSIGRISVNIVGDLAED
jgi:anti-sigma28 factor (negative regulator of flagellin synthesis)